MRDGRLPSNHRGDRSHAGETPRITGSRLRRPRRAASWAPLWPPSLSRRARLRAPRGGGRLCAAFRHAGAETTWSGSATAHNRKQHIEREVSSAWAEGATRRFAADTSRLGSCCAWSPSRFGSVGLSAGWLWAVTGSPRMSTISGLASELLGVIFGAGDRNASSLDAWQRLSPMLPHAEGCVQQRREGSTSARFVHPYLAIALDAGRGCCCIGQHSSYRTGIGGGRAAPVRTPDGRSVRLWAPRAVGVDLGGEPADRRSGDRGREWL